MRWSFDGWLFFLPVFPWNQGPHSWPGFCRWFAKYVSTSCEYEPERLLAASAWGPRNSLTLMPQSDQPDSCGKSRAVGGCGPPMLNLLGG
jgi:hypothetical protein